MNDPILEAFFEEADERLLELEEDLLRLEQNPADREVLDRIFRCAHTLKGNSGMLGLDEIAHFTHALEDLLDLLRKGLRIVTPEIVDALLASRDALKHLVAVAKGQAAPNPDVTAGVMNVLTALLVEREPAPEVAVAQGAAPATPKPAEPEHDAFGFFDEEPASQAAPPVVAPAAPAVAPASASATPPPAPERTGPPKPTAQPRGNATPSSGSSSENASIRVPVEKVDRLINLVGELVITQSMIAQALDSKNPEGLAALEGAVAQMDRHARELHERMMAIRMVPIRSLFARFPRLLRDLASMTGKQVALETSGEETELDKTVIERITDPLTHLVRNAVDHGVETPEERRAAGKAPQASVRISAFQRGSSVYIEVADDGKGIDRDRIRAKGVQNGLISADAVLGDEQILALIFRPGFSTAAKVTEISGRGVGMDVVKRNVEALGGQVSIRSELGKGTVFQIKLPLTLAIMDGQVVTVGPQTFVVPLIAITESVRPTAEMLHAPAGAPPVVVVREKVLPILPLHELFSIQPRARRAQEGLLMVVESEGNLAALMVDELLGQQQVVIKNLENNYRKVGGVSGATILGDGRVALILDIPGLLELASSRASEPVLT